MNIALMLVGLIAVGLAAAVLVLIRRQQSLQRDLADRERHAGDLAAAVEEEQHRGRQLEAILEEAELGILAVRRDGTIEFANPAAARFISARHGEAVAEVRIREMLDEVLTEGQPLRREVELYAPVPRVLQMVAVPRPGWGAVVYIEDLTEEYRLESVRRDFMANVGHELKTPLGAISILAEALAQSDDAETRDHLEARLMHESQRTATLVDDLLALSQVESYHAEHVRVDAGVVVDDALEQVRIAAEENGIEIGAAPIPADAYIAGDARQLTTAVSNLLDNAVKYTAIEHYGGKVAVRVIVTSESVAIEVEDHGIGIPAQHVDHIFERFYRVDRARSRATGGTGLGLAIVEHVAINHGGTVRVTSEPGLGSTFTLVLPRWTE